MTSRIGVLLQTAAQLGSGAGVDLSPSSRARRFQSTLSDVGSAAVALQNDDALLASVAYGKYVRFSVDGTPRFLMRVGGRDRQHIDPGEEFNEHTALIGLGVVDEWSKAQVDPPNGDDGQPLTDTRVFNYASSELDISGWSAAVEISQQNTDPPVLAPAGWFGSPIGWPDGPGWFIWSQATPGAGQPVGSSFFAKDITIATAGVYSVYSAADNGHKLWIDGVLVAVENSTDILPGGAGNPRGFQDPMRTDLYLSAGVHRFAFEGINADAFADMTNSIAGVIFAIYSQDENGDDDTLIDRSDDTWKAVNYPSVPPGFTVGEVLRILLEDAQAGGYLTDWTLDCTDSVDSDGASWPTDWAYSFPVGTDLLTVLRQLARTDIDFVPDPSDKILHVYVAGTYGVAEGAETATLDDLGALGFRGDESVYDKLRIRWKYGYTTVGSGARIGFLSLGHVDTEAEAERIGLLELAQMSTDRDQVRIGVDPDDVFTDYDVGDFVLAPDPSGVLDSYRVRELTIIEDDESAELDVRAVVGTRMDEWRVRTARTVNRLLPGNLAGSAVASPIVTPRFVQARRATMVSETFHFPGVPTAGVESDPWRPTRNGRLAQMQLDLGVADGGSNLTVEVFVNGVSVGTGIVWAGDTAGFGFINTTFTSTDQATVEVTASAGEGLVVRLFQAYF